MNLTSMRIENFRQFCGTQELKFARGGTEKNVTVVHGYNGSGKTALLNAFIWCLYGKTSADFEADDKLENERTVAESKVGDEIQVSVRLQYKARGEEHIIERRRVATKTSASTLEPREPEFKMWRFIDGEVESAHEDPRVRQNLVNEMLPEALYPFFFFNGERVESLASAQGSIEVESGVKTLLDVEIYERSMRHLRDAVSRELSTELKSFGNAELRTALDEEQALLDFMARCVEELDQLRHNVRAMEDERKAIEARQASQRARRSLTEDRARARAHLDDAQKADREVQVELADQLSQDGYLAFGEGAFAKSEALVAAARKRGDLPAKIKPQFVTDLLNSGACICGRPLELERDEAEVKRLEAWRENVGLADHEEAISQLNASIGPLRRRRDTYYGQIDRLQARRSEGQQQIANYKEELEVIEQELGDEKYGADGPDLANRLATLRHEEINARANIKHWEAEHAKTEEALRSLRRGIEKLKQQNAKAALIKRQKEVVDRVADVLEIIFDAQKEEVRSDVSRRLAEIWDDVAIKDFTASLTEDFRLNLTKTVAGSQHPVHGASTGEKQVLALAFVGSLVQKAKENLLRGGDKPALGVPQGGEYPLVMDSPFGSLEDDYRAKVAQWIPQLANQVIVMVSKTQWRDEVESQMRHRIGAEYVLELHTAKRGADRSITIDGEQWPYVVCTHDPVEQTLIKRVN